MPGLGRRPEPDERDRAFLMERLLPEAAAVVLPARKTWGIAPRALDQGATGSCVGHGWRNFLRCAPIRTEKGGPSPFDIYRAAVRLDSWSDNDDEAALPDGDPGMDFGTSVRAGAKAVSGLGHLSSYVWAFTLQPAIEWVLTRGPIVLGTDWYSSFFSPDAQGVVRIEPGASVVGGHCYLLRGVDTRRALARCTNSWGDGFGVSGDFLLPLRDLERLIHAGGECCSAVERKLLPVQAGGGATMPGSYPGEPSSSLGPVTNSGRVPGPDP